MRILFAHDNNNYLRGLSQVAAFCGHNAIVWNHKHKRFHEVANGFQPEMIISSLHDDGIVQYLIRHPEVMSLWKEEELGNDICNVVENCYNWRVFSLKEHPYAANLFDGHYDYNTNKLFDTITSVQKTEDTERWLKTFVDYQTDYNVKIFSSDNWPGEHYCGQVTDEEFSKIANLSQCVINFDGITQRVMNAILCRAFVISTPIDIPAIPLFNTYDELLYHLDYYIAHPKDTRISIDESHKHVIQNHTYFHRFNSLLKEFSLQSNTLDKLKELYDKS